MNNVLNDYGVDIKTNLMSANERLRKLRLKTNEQIMNKTANGEFSFVETNSTRRAAQTFSSVRNSPKSTIGSHRPESVNTNIQFNPRIASAI